MKRRIQRMAVTCAIVVATTGWTARGEEPRKGVHGRIYYSGEAAHLEATSLGSWGWHTKEKAVSSAGSKAGIDIVWGDKWYQRLGLEGYSTESLFPGQVGKGPEADISLDRIALIWGMSEGALPSAKFTYTEFQATGVSDGTLPIFEDGRPLAKGDEFNVGVTYTSYLLVWNLGTENPENPYTGSFMKYGLGLAHLKFLGTREEWGGNGPPTRQDVGEEADGWGVALDIELLYGAMEVAENAHFYVGAHGEVAATSVGGMIKAGYEIGLSIEPTDNIRLRPYVGGYFWPLTNWESNFGGVETDFGYSYGLQLECAW